MVGGVAGFNGSREDVGQGFWRERSAEREKVATFVEGEGEEAKSRAGYKVKKIENSQFFWANVDTHP